jgi:hypothetical protein
MWRYVAFNSGSLTMGQKVQVGIFAVSLAFLAYILWDGFYLGFRGYSVRIAPWYLGTSLLVSVIRRIMSKRRSYSDFM